MFDLRPCSSLRADSSSCWTLHSLSSHSSLWASSVESCSALCCSAAARRFSSSNLRMRVGQSGAQDAERVTPPPPTRPPSSKIRGKRFLLFLVQSGGFAEFFLAGRLHLPDRFPLFFHQGFLVSLHGRL